MDTNQAIDGGKGFDWGRTSKAYARFRDIYPEELYQRLTGLGLCTAGQDVLDLGTGTGVLPRGLYKYGARFVGVDSAESQIAEAKRLSAEAGMDIEYAVCAAEDIDFPAESFDVVTACQCIIYFDKDSTLPKIHKVLKPGGRFAVVWMAWLREEDDIAMATERLVLKHNPHWTSAGYTRPGAAEHGWDEPLLGAEHSVAFDVALPFTRESWHGRMMACRGTGASSLPAEKIAAFEEEHRRFLAGCPPRFDILHHVTIRVARKTG